MGKKLTAKSLLREVRAIKKKAMSGAWYETSDHPQVQKAFAEIEKALNSFRKVNDLPELVVAQSDYMYSDPMGYTTQVNVYDPVSQNTVEFYIGGDWDDPENAMILGAEAGEILWKKKFSGDINKDVSMAVANMKKFIKNGLLDFILRERL